jgi:hypothetical protein
VRYRYRGGLGMMESEVRSIIDEERSEVDLSMESVFGLVRIIELAAIL